MTITVYTKVKTPADKHVGTLFEARGNFLGVSARHTAPNSSAGCKDDDYQLWSSSWMAATPSSPLPTSSDVRVA